MRQSAGSDKEHPWWDEYRDDDRRRVPATGSRDARADLSGDGSRPQGRSGGSATVAAGSRGSELAACAGDDCPLGRKPTRDIPWDRSRTVPPAHGPEPAGNTPTVHGTAERPTAEGSSQAYSPGRPRTAQVTDRLSSVADSSCSCPALLRLDHGGRGSGAARLLVNGHCASMPHGGHFSHLCVG